jgi:hypothetical protein
VLTCPAPGVVTSILYSGLAHDTVGERFLRLKREGGERERVGGREIETALALPARCALNRSLQCKSHPLPEVVTGRYPTSSWAG